MIAAEVLAVEAIAWLKLQSLRVILASVVALGRMAIEHLVERWEAMEDTKAVARPIEMLETIAIADSAVADDECYCSGNILGW